jgi:AraC-like DNA-binding protein
MKRVSPQHEHFAISLLGTDPGWDLYVQENQCSVIWPVGGEIICRVRGNVLRIPRFSFLVTRMCRVRGRGEGMFAFIELTPEFLDGVLRESEVEIPLEQPNFWLARPQGRHLELARFYIVTLWAEFEQQLPHYHLAIRSNLCGLLCHLLREPRRIDGLDTFALAEVRENSSEAKVFSLIARLRKEYTQPWTLKDMCRESGVNRTTLNTIFRRATGWSPLAFVQRLRVLRARDMLQATDAPVERVAAAVGFHDQRHFYRVFKNYMGKTPGECRNDRTV